METQNDKIYDQIADATSEMLVVIDQAKDALRALIAAEHEYENGGYEVIPAAEELSTRIMRTARAISTLYLAAGFEQSWLDVIRSVK